MIPYADPKEIKDNSPVGGVIYEHPAFGQISVSRVSGGANLHGSDFRHQNYVTISISTARLRRSLSIHHSDKELIEVALSEAQWATFVSSMNTSGMPCTLMRMQGQLVPQLKQPMSNKEQFSTDVSESLDSAMAALQEATSLLQESGLSSKKREEIAAKLAKAQQEISCNIDFVGTQFGKHMEKTVERAKIEIDAYAEMTVQRAGLRALAGEGGSTETTQLVPITLDAESGSEDGQAEDASDRPRG